MDISDVLTREASEKGAEMRVISPHDGKPTDFYIEVAGTDSKRYRMASKKAHNKMLSDLADGGTISEDVQLDEEINLAVALTIGWRGLENNGDTVEFTVEQAKKIYLDAPWLVNQIDRFASKRANFTKG